MNIIDRTKAAPVQKAQDTELEKAASDRERKGRKKKEAVMEPKAERKKEPLFHKDFTLVVIGQIISLFGNNILRFALPLYLLKTTGSAALFGAVSACSFLPMIALSPVGGIVADRVNKRNIMVILDFATAALILVFSLAMGNVPLVPLLVATLMFLYGIQGAYQPAVQASIPLLATGENTMPANAVINQVSSLAGLLGPVVGGIIYGVWGLPPILAVSGVCFLFSAVMEIFIHIPHKKAEDSRGVWSIAAGDLRVSIQFIRKDKPIMARIIGLICAFNLFMSSMVIIGLPVLITQTLEMSSRLYGFSQGALAAGGLAGGIFVSIFSRALSIQKAHRLLLFCAVGILPMGLCLMWGFPNFVCYLIITVMNFFLMACSTVFTILMITYVQVETPAALIGKVISCLMAFSMCAQPVGQAMYGVLFESFSQRPWIVVIGAAGASAVIALLSAGTFSGLGAEKKGAEAVRAKVEKAAKHS